MKQSLDSNSVSPPFSYVKRGEQDLHMYHLFLNYPPHTHLELLNSSLQALRGEAGLFGRQLILCRLKPPEERAREATELEQLLLTRPNGSKPV